MSLEPAEFRRVMGHWATGVAIVAAQRPDGTPCGMTANAVCSLSLHPPLLLVCIEHAADTHDCIREAGAFAISMLDSGQERLARRFADWDAADKFNGVAYRTEQTGAPVLEDALAWADCTLHAEYDGGDHTIFVGLIGAADARDGRPLIFFRGGYGPP